VNCLRFSQVVNPDRNLIDCDRRRLALFRFLYLRGKGIVRIPLDYYRILGLPIQATSDQLQQAHRDRTLQLPRREFSEVAIAARRELLDEAFAILSDPTQRQAYDASFLAKSYDLPTEDLDDAFPENGMASGSLFSPNGASAAEPPDPYTSSIDIPDHQFIGALLILLEVGEYELVLKLGRPYLVGDAAPSGADDAITGSDIVLTVSLACLELGREQWQQGQYENAADSLMTGKEVLLQAGLFASIRGEMYTDLSKLRPYRILELLALPETHKADREQGLALLTDMLEERGGIDGNQDDQSGLGMDDFIRFIQQLRSYLTAAEQHALFEKESRRPSAVATYLAVYALLARGFAQRQPGLVRRAKQMLTRLGSRQDVHLEQAVCAMLLGQTEEASRAIDLSQEVESIAFIQEHSQGAPDLLPGLCLYSERWLQNEVFPHFRDLARKPASLKEYFADEDVQGYLEELPSEPESVALVTRSTYRTPRAEVGTIAEPRLSVTHSRDYQSNGSGSTAVIDPPELVEPTDAATASHWDGNSRDDTAPIRIGDDTRRSPLSVGDGTRRPKGRSPRLDRLLFLVALSVLGVALVAFLANWLLRRGSQPATATVSPSAVVVVPTARSLSPALTQIAPPPSIGGAAASTLNTEGAQVVIKNWLTAKSAAMGETRAVDQLPKVLTGTALTQWQKWAEDDKSNNSYLKYEHANVAVNSVQWNPETPDQATVEATVNEKKESYVNGKLDGVPTTPADLQIRYTLVRQNGQWLIQAIEPL
jgi:curved DNA-binding protein CbpA